MPPKELTKKYPAEARLYTEPKKRLLIRHLELCLQFAAQTPSGPARTSQPAAVSIPKPTPAEIKSLNKTGNCIYRNITKLIKETSLCWDDFLSAISEETLRGYAQAQKNRSPHFPPSEVPQDLLIKTPPLPSQLLKKKKPKKAAKTSKGTKPMLSKAAPQKTPRAKPITKKQYLDENCPEAALWGDSSGRRKKGEWFEEAPDALSDIFDDDALAAVRGW